MLTFQQDFFERTAERMPAAIAVDDHGETISYGALDGRANRIAHLLRGLGAGPNRRVCVFTGKTLQMYAGVLGSLKSGACWVPLSTAYPPDRLDWLLASLRPTAVLVDAETLPIARSLPALQSDGTPLVLLGGDAAGVLGESDLATQPDDRPERSAQSPDDLAYIIFTSGSTGSPKGVMVLHRNTSQFLALCDDLFGIPEGARFAHFSELTFDPSVFDLFHCWARGGTLVPMNRRKYRINPGLFLKEQAIEVLFTVPSALAKLRDVGSLGDPAFAGISHLLLTGEALPPKLVRAWHDAYPACRIFNMYGTTETAIISHCYEIPPDFDDTATIPLGRPLPGTRVLLLDGDRPVAAGETGESVVYGSQLSPGYWANPFQTAGAFVRNPLDPDLPQTVYRTGDLLREGPDGLHYYVGRADDQLKVRGHRVELGEIESVLMQIEAVRDAAVVAVTPSGAGHDRRLVAFVRADRDAAVETASGHAAKQLPSYMVPSPIIPVLEDMPRSANGKIDRRALERLALDALSAKEAR